MLTGTLIAVASPAIVTVGVALRLVILILAKRRKTTSAPKAWIFRIDRKKPDGSQITVSISSLEGNFTRANAQRLVDVYAQTGNAPAKKATKLVARKQSKSTPINADFPVTGLPANETTPHEKTSEDGK
jgi:hypothetical protein